MSPDRTTQPEPMLVGIAADHGGYELKKILLDELKAWGYRVRDFGAASFTPDDDYPDFVIPLARALSSGRVVRGIAICGSGIGASVAASKVDGVRAALIHDAFSARQGVEDDDLNLMCLGARVIGPSLALELVRIFLYTQFSGAARHRRRLAKVAALEADNQLPTKEGIPCQNAPE